MTCRFVSPLLLAAALHAGLGGRLDGQSLPLTLGALQDSALRSDPRARQAQLLQRQTDLRVRTLASELLPAFALEGQAQYQSDVARIPLTLPGGAPTPPHDTYDARIAASQRLYDPGFRARRAVELAELAQSQARLRAILEATRQQVNDAFFTALRAQVQGDELQAAIAALESQRVVAANRVRAGTALPSEENSIHAEVLRRRQALIEARSHASAARAVLAELTGVAMDSATALAQPDLAARVRDARAPDAVGLRRRPEYEQFARSRDLLERQERARGAQDLPRASAFGRLGYGRPGLNPLNATFDSYWLAGIQLQWSPWTWGASRRDREVLAVQRLVVTADEDAFTEQVQRAATQDLATIDRLEAMLALDEDIIALRQRIEEETRVRFAEAVVTSAEFVDRQTDLLAARLTRAIHRVELAQARARFLTTLGLEVN
jgi:outer membrane protein TolC